MEYAGCCNNAKELLYIAEKAGINGVAVMCLACESIWKHKKDDIN